MSRNVRRLFKQPRHPRRWPLQVYALLALLIMALAGVVWLIIDVKPSKFPPTDEANQWAAEAAIIGGGALFFAIVATAFAVLAYINSTERPKLRLEPSFSWKPTPQPPAPDSIPGRFPDWALRLRIYNDGPIAARNLAVRVTFSGAVSLVTQPHAGLLAPWQALSPDDPWPTQLWWEGGADAVVHPSPAWPFEIPQLGRAPLQVFDLESDQPVTFTVEVVADDVRPVKKTLTIPVWGATGLHENAGRKSTT